MIPKIIHYCWFGGKELPIEYQAYIAEWQQFHPDWEIKRWDERNAPLDFDYLTNALAGDFFSNMSNFIRLYSLKEFGGIYLDTDVKLIKPLESLLSERCFFGFENGEGTAESFWVNNAICGAEKGHDFIIGCFNELLVQYDGTEQSNLSGPQLTTKQLIAARGLKHYGLQKLQDVTLYPTEYFYPIPWYLAKDTENYQDFISAETYAVHMWGRSWFTKEMMLQMIDDLQKWSSDQSKYISDLKNGLEYEQARVKDLDGQNAEHVQKIEELLQLIQDHQATVKIHENSFHELSLENKDLSELNQELRSYMSKLNDSMFSILECNKSLVDSQQSSVLFAETVEQQYNNLQTTCETLPALLQKILSISEKSLNSLAVSNQQINSLAGENAMLQKGLQDANTRIASLEEKIADAASHSDHMIQNLQEKLLFSNEFILKKIDESKFLVGNVIHSLNEAYNKQKTINDELNQKLSEKQIELDACKNLLSESSSSLNQQEVSIQWYQRTYEHRSLMGIIKEKFFTGNRSH